MSRDDIRLTKFQYRAPRRADMAVRLQQQHLRAAVPTQTSINKETPMFRCAILGMIFLFAGGAVVFAQPSPNRPETPAPPAASAPATPSDISETMEEAMPGDHWTYETHDEITGDLKATATNTVMEVTAATISLRFNILGNPLAGYITYDRSWNVVNNGDWKYAPNDGTGVRLPLSVGKKWSFQSTDSNSTRGLSFKRSGTSTVTAKENITTSAGSF